jgi:dihydrofolate reductase
MRRLRYSVAQSLDGYIADNEGGYDWIPADDAIDFASYLEKIDTLLMGRGTWEIMQTPEGRSILDGMTTYVVSTTLDASTYPEVTLISSDVEATVAALKAEEGKDIWLFGGGVLFKSLLDAGLVDRVEVAVIPTLLGSGIPLLPGSAAPTKMELHSEETFASGIVLLKYDVLQGGQEADEAP